MKYEKIVEKILPTLINEYEITFYNSAQLREIQQKEKGQDSKKSKKSKYSDSDDDDESEEESEESEDESEAKKQISQLIKDDEENEKTIKLFAELSKYFSYSTRSSKNKGYKVDELNNNEYGNDLKQYDIESHSGWCIVALEDVNVYGMPPDDIDKMLNKLNHNNGYTITFYQSNKLKQQQQNQGSSNESSKKGSKTKGNKIAELVSKEGKEEIILKLFENLDYYFTMSARNSAGRGLKVDEVIIENITSDFEIESYSGWCIVSIDGVNIYGMKRDKIDSKLNGINHKNGYDVTFYCSSKLKQQQQDELNKRNEKNKQKAEQENINKILESHKNDDVILIENKSNNHKIIRIKGSISDVITWNSSTGGKGMKIENINTSTEVGKELKKMYKIKPGWLINSINGKNISNKKFANIKLVLRGLDKSNGYDVEFMNKNDENDDDNDSKSDGVAQLVNDGGENDKELKLFAPLHNFLMFVNGDNGNGMVIKKVFEYNEHGAKLTKEFGIDTNGGWFISEINKQDVTNMSFINIKSMLYETYKNSNGYIIRFVRGNGSNNDPSIQKSSTNLATSDTDSDEDTKSLILQVIKNKSNKKIAKFFFDLTEYVEYEARFKKRGFKITKVSKKNKYGKKLKEDLDIPKQGGWYISKIEDDDVSNEKLKKILSKLDELASKNNGYKVELLPDNEDSSSEEDGPDSPPPPANPAKLKSIPKKSYKSPQMEPIKGFAVSNTINASEQPMRTKHAKKRSKYQDLDSDSD